MIMVSSQSNLPVVQELTLAYVLSLVAGALMTVASVAGLLFPSTLYPTDALLQSCLPNDVINLIIGVPILLGSMWLTRRGQLLGLLFWPGALMYMLYNYIAYAFIVPFTWAMLLAVVLVIISVYALITLITQLDGEAIQRQLTGAVPEKLSAGMLIAFGVMFIGRAADIVFKAISTRTALPATEWSVLVSDLVLSLAWIIGGVSLWRRRALGYISGAGLLFAGSTLFIGLILLLILQPLLTTAPLLVNDIIVVSIMTLICNIPFALFVRGVIAKSAAQ